MAAASSPSRPPPSPSTPPPSWQDRRARRKRWDRSQIAIAAAVIGFLVVVGVTFQRRGGSSAAEASRFRGTYLGMTAPEVRQRFASGAPGHWAASTSSVGEEALVWTAESVTAPVATATFEFHDRILVAVRAALDPSAPESSGPPRVVTPVTVRALSSPAATPGSTATPTAADSSLTILARDCPTHAPEVARLMAAAD